MTTLGTGRRALPLALTQRVGSFTRYVHAKKSTTEGLLPVPRVEAEQWHIDVAKAELGEKSLMLASHWLPVAKEGLNRLWQMARPMCTGDEYLIILQPVIPRGQAALSLYPTHALQVDAEVLRPPRAAAPIEAVAGVSRVEATLVAVDGDGRTPRLALLATAVGCGAAEDLSEMSRAEDDTLRPREASRAIHGDGELGAAVRPLVRKNQRRAHLLVVGLIVDEWISRLVCPALVVVEDVDEDAGVRQSALRAPFVAIRLASKPGIDCVANRFADRRRG